MIEEIKLLLPLLTALTDGAFWGVMAYFGIAVLKVLLFNGFLFLLLVLAYKLLSRVVKPDVDRRYPSNLLEAVEAVRQAWLFDSRKGTEDSVRLHTAYTTLEAMVMERRPK